MRKIYIALTLLATIAIISALYLKEGSLPVNTKNNTPVQFTINKGDSLNKIIDNLSRNKLIRNKIAFYFTVNRLGIAQKIQAGEYRLSQALSAEEIAKTITVGRSDLWITIVEGLRSEEIAFMLSKELSIPESQFLAYAKEGYLFPDTYSIQKETTAENVINLLTENFNKKYQENIAPKAQNSPLSMEEIVILASIVEKEAKSDADRQRAASVLLKRLQNDWPLQVDATIQYALGYQSVDKTWWKKNLTAADLAIESAYNTYKNKGLPPTPICNPGLSSLRAVVEANPSTPYWFYISNRDGSDMHFARTSQEHEENIRKYLR